MHQSRILRATARRSYSGFSAARTTRIQSSFSILDNGMYCVVAIIKFCFCFSLLPKDLDLFSVAFLESGNISPSANVAL